MHEYRSIDELMNGMSKGHDTFSLKAPRSFFHNGWDFEFHGKKEEQHLLGHYHIRSRNDMKRRPRDSEYLFPQSDNSTLSLLIYLTEIPFSSDVVHGLFSYKGEEQTPEEKYLNTFQDRRMKEQLGCVIKEYRDCLNEGHSFEEEHYRDIIDEVSKRNVRDVSITRGRNVNTMRISAYMAGRKDSVEGILFSIYNSALMKHSQHLSLMQQAFKKHRPEESVLPVGGSYLNAIAFKNEDKNLLVGITGERSKHNGWIHEPLRPLLLDLIRHELTARSQGEEVYLVHAFPNAMPYTQRT